MARGQPELDGGVQADRAPKVRPPTFGFESAAFDFPVATPPKEFYIICSTPRCGSTWLSVLLWRTGLAGAPDEYFNYNSIMLHYARRWPVRTLTDYTHAILRRRTGPNGVFGMKCHYDHLDMISDLPRVAEQIRPVRLIHVERRDAVAQAVSAAFAGATGQTRSFQPERWAPRYDAEQIDKWLVNLRRFRRQWEKYFERKGARPYRVRYEKMLTAPEATVEGVLRFLGVTGQVAEHVPALPELQQQSDPRKDEWIARYKQERGLA